MYNTLQQSCPYRTDIRNLKHKGRGDSVSRLLLHQRGFLSSDFPCNGHYQESSPGESHERAQYASGGAPRKIMREEHTHV